MKYFLINTLKIAFAFSLIMASLLAGTNLIINSFASFHIPQEKNIIVIGDSHTQCAINDAIFSRAVNISHGGAAYIYSYVILRKFLSVNSHIDTVLLSFHGKAIDRERDSWIMEDRFITNYVPLFLPWFYSDEVFYMAKNSTFFFATAKSLTTSVKRTFQIASQGYLMYNNLNIGQYERIDRIMSEQKEVHRSVLKNKKTEPDGYSQYQHDYLLKIVELCKAYNIELILFNSPTYQANIYGKKTALMDYYNHYLSGVKYMDFSNFDLPKDGYADIDHLNYKGSEIFSRYLENNYETVFGH